MLGLPKVWLGVEKGFAPVFMLLLLVAGIGLGSYLVQNRTNFVPFAATDECGNDKSGSGDESKCIKFKVTPCKPEGNNGKCGVKFEWALPAGKDINDIDVRVSDKEGKSVYSRAKTECGKQIELAAGEYNAIISHGNFGDDFNDNNRDKLRFTVGGSSTAVTWGSFSGEFCKGAKTGDTSPSSTNQNSNSSDSSSKLNTSNNTNSSNTSIHSGVPELQGKFPTNDPGDFVPSDRKLATLKKFLDGSIKGKIVCRNTNAQSNEGSATGDAKKNDSSMWVIADNPGGEVPKEEYIIDCSRTAMGSYKGWESVKCGKLKSGSSYQFGCIDTSLTGSSNSSKADSRQTSNGAPSSKDENGKVITQKGPGDTNAAAQTAPVAPPTLTEQQIKDCGFSISEEGIPLFAVQVGGHASEESKNCQELIDLQLKYFDGIVAKAKAEAEEAKKNGAANAEELVAKAETANKAVTDCQGKTGTEFATCAKTAQQTVQGAATAAQSQAIRNALKKLEEIMAKKRPGGCVKADLGITPFLEAQRLKRKPSRGTGGVENDEARRLLLCQGDKENNLTWRVLVGGAASENGKDDGDKCGSGDCGNDAERIYGLHGTTPDATGAPKYPYTVPGKNGFVINDPNKEGGVEATLGKYIEAAKAGKTTLRAANSGQHTPDTDDSTPNPGSKE